MAALGDDLVHQLIVRVKLLLGLALQLGVLPQGLLGVCQRRFQLEGGAACLRGVGLVHDDGKTAPGGLVHLLEDHRELLQGGDDDPHPSVQSVPQILGGLVLTDGFHRPQRVVKARNRFLELGVKDSPIRDHHHAAEHGPVLLAVQRRQPVGRPGDGVGLARACAVLDQVVPPGTVRRHVGQQLPHHVQLMVAGKNQRLLSYSLHGAVWEPFFLLLHLQMDELLKDIHHAVPLKDLLPEIGRGVAVRIWRIALAAVLSGPVGALVEGQKVCILPGQPGGHPDLGVIHAEIAQDALVELETELP